MMKPDIPPPADIEAPSPFDRLLHGMLGQLTQGVSPTSLALAGLDWGMHLALSPAKLHRLLFKAVDKDLRWLGYVARSGPAAQDDRPCIAPLPQDRRFRAPSWQRWPYNVLQQAFLLNQQWWHNATTGIDGVSAHHEQVVAFVARQLLDLASPLNFLATNPEVAAATAREGGANLVRGAFNFAQDWQRRALGAPAKETLAFQPGVAVAVTPGEVVFRNHLIELIQYAPTSAAVHAEPMLIVPAWIMKYYILDLSPENSLVRQLVAQGHTVFMISWHNPNAADGELGMEDYLQDGVFAALDVIDALLPGQPVNTTGYCLGGTLLAIAAAALACDPAARINSITLLAAQTDFSEAGELMLFIDESQIAWLEDLMHQQGYLDNRQMAGAFRLLRSNDLVWSLAVNQYLLGRQAPINDLMAWNSDATRMPAKMHGDYLRHLFLGNDLVAGRYRVAGRPVALSNIHAPVFAVATLTDHVSPWRSVHKIHLVPSFDVHFVLTSGGHNAGIVSEPGHPGRYFYANEHRRGTCYDDPERWVEHARRHDGSWWPQWWAWLDKVSALAPVPARPAAPALGAAPGAYVLER